MGCPNFPDSVSKSFEKFITEHSLKSTIEYIGEWESMSNPIFNYTEFDIIKNAAGSNNFVLSMKMWIEKTGAIGLTAKAGRYGGTYAHKDIAFHFGMWISPKFQLLLVKEYQRLKVDENERLKLEWNFQRILSKVCQGTLLDHSVMYACGIIRQFQFRY